MQSQSGEEGNDCTYSKEIIIPFNSPGAATTKHFINQTVFYSHHDQFSFFYKIVVKENSSLGFKVDALNDSDSYAVYVYQYNRKDFCNKLYFHKILPVKPNFFINKIPSTETSFPFQKAFNVKKDSIYYISVLNTSLNNCGHTFTLVNDVDTLKVKAVHIPCKRDVSSLTLKPAVITTTVKNQDTMVGKINTQEIMPIKIKPDTSLGNLLFCIVKDSKKNTVLKIKPVITDVSGGEELSLGNLETGEWSCPVVKGKSYKIKCNALGYKNYVQTIETGATTPTHTVLLEPLKPGDFFVMKSIYFYPNTYALKKESAPELQKLVDFLTENNSVSIEIQGHTNGDHKIAKNKAYASLGEEWNFSGTAKELSQKRAEVIKNYLINNRIAAERLIPKGFGGKKPIIIDPQDNEEGQMNIRVEIVILKS
jgi:outer membrane protein OmpA-like peptidoglycan-associated protein